MHTIRISLDSDSNSCDEVALVGAVSSLLEVAPEDIVVLKVERSLLITRKLTGLILCSCVCAAPLVMVTPLAAGLCVLFGCGC